MAVLFKPRQRLGTKKSPFLMKENRQLNLKLAISIVVGAVIAISAVVAAPIVQDKYDAASIDAKLMDIIQRCSDRFESNSLRCVDRTL